MSTAVLNDKTQSEAAVDDAAMYEIVYGRRVELPPMSAYASWIAFRLGKRMDIFAEEHSLGTVVTETLFILDEANDVRRRPDVAFISAATWPLDRLPPEKGDWPVVPTLAVEVASPNDTLEALLAKMREYFSFGVRQVWIIIPGDRSAFIYTAPRNGKMLSINDDLDGGTLLPGFRMPLATLFKNENASAEKTT